MQAIKKALQIIMTDESQKEVRIVSSKELVLLLIAKHQPAIHLKSADDR